MTSFDLTSVPKTMIEMVVFSKQGRNWIITSDSCLLRNDGLGFGLKVDHFDPIMTWFDLWETSLTLEKSECRKIGMYIVLLSKDFFYGF